ncbi:GGDEF domain-containing protein [Sulfurospirillum sp. 1307]
MTKFNSFNIISLSAIFIVSIISYLDFIPRDTLLKLKDIFMGINILALGFSLYFSRSKIFVLLFIPLLFNLYMFYPNLIGLDGGKYSFWHIYPISTAISFLFIGILEERGVFCYYGLIKIIAMFFLLAITYYLLHDFSLQLKMALDTKIFDFTLPSFIKTNQLTIILFIISIIFNFTILFFRKISHTELSIFWVLIALLVPSLFFKTQSAFILFSALGSLLFITALLKDAYTMAYIDTLTQIPARRALEEEFLKLGNNFTLAMVDIDHFKKFNDTHGHDVGDEVLKLVASELKKTKGGAKAFRYGGEEFTILFSNKNSKEALPFLEETREAIEKRDFKLRAKDRPDKKPEKIQKRDNQKVLHVTVSIGVANSTKNVKNPETILKNADLALYQAKSKGRNCIMTI